MSNRFLIWLRVTYRKIIDSIAFRPAIIAIIFLLLALLMIRFDFSATGRNIKSNLHWLSLKDATTARSIISTITAGIISLTVFSFSLVMILLNQAASQMSNRILDNLIGNRFQQYVLGFYIGTTVYGLFLLSTIRDIDSGVYIPAISTYFLIACTIMDIFLFIYFLHYITQSVKYETIIYNIHDQTEKEMKATCTLTKAQEDDEFTRRKNFQVLKAYKSGIFQGYYTKDLMKVCNENDIVIEFLLPISTYILEGNSIAHIYGNKKLDEKLEKILNALINIHRDQKIEACYYYGFRQLMEVAVKSLSPGINDPDTAIISLQSITDLLAYRMQFHPSKFVENEKAEIRIINCEKSFSDIFSETVLPIWDYGKNDRLIGKEMTHLLTQLKATDENIDINSFYQEVIQHKSTNNN